jgi:hypothetical protein
MDYKPTTVRQKSLAGETSIDPLLIRILHSFPANSLYLFII